MGFMTELNAAISPVFAMFIGTSIHVSPRLAELSLQLARLLQNHSI